MTTIQLEIASDHPAFAGHFPGQPIVPGVVLLDLAQQAIQHASGEELVGLQQAKFHSPVKPGEPLVLEYQSMETAIRFEISSGTRKVADGKFLQRKETPA